ncbi:type IV toxin-antitoxin system AbiEi family antitoxin domain-containing protein [Leucobacter sp. HY1910]
MKYRPALRELAEITESQWGMVTSAQALARGLSHVDLARLADNGDLVRLAHGVYKDAGAPSSEHEDLRAAWLSIEPKQLAWERTQHRPSFATVSGETATVLYGVGDLRAMRTEFTTLRRKQTQREEIRYKTRTLTREDVTIREGLPVTTVERTIADLVEARTQLEHIGAVIRDANRKMNLDMEKLESYLTPLAERNGHRKGDGEALLQELLEAAHIDNETVAAQLASHEELGAMIASKFIASLPGADRAAVVRKTSGARGNSSDYLKVVDWINLAARAEYPGFKSTEDER